MFLLRTRPYTNRPELNIVRKISGPIPRQTIRGVLGDGNHVVASKSSLECHYLILGCYIVDSAPKTPLIVFYEI